MTQSSLSKQLRRLRRKKHLRQADIARELNIVRQTYSNYETGNRLPSLETLMNLADFYQVPVDFLLREDGPQKLASFMYPISDTEKTILTAFRSFPPLFQREYLEYTQLKSRIASSQKRNRKTAAGGKRK